MTYVYRFQDLAALSAIRVHSDPQARGDTIYMSTLEARGVAEALLRVVQSIETERFTDSTVGTILVDPDGTILDRDTA